MSKQPFVVSPYAGASDHAAVTLLSTIFLPVTVFSACLALNMGEARWILPIAALLFSPLFTYALLKVRSASLPLSAWIAPPCFFLLALACSCFILDTSYDGMTYDAGAVLGLLKGYNPYHELLHAPYDFWIVHYPKATWYFGALIAHVTGHYQMGKSYHLILAFCVMLYGYSFFRQRGIAQADSGLLAIAAALNPVVVNQIFVYYVDGALGSLLTLLLFSALNLLREPRKSDRLIFIMAGSLFINVKFSAAAYMATLCALAFMYMVYNGIIRKNPAFMSVLAARVIDISAVLLIGIALIGFNPYITNTLLNGNPMYPLLGKGSADVMTNQSPDIFNSPKLNRIEKLAWSFASHTAQITPRTGGEPQLKLPFSVQSSELAVFKDSDARIAGWGVLMSGIMLLSVLLYASERGWQNKEVTLALILTIGTVLVNPHAWWARYAPQVAFIPLLLALPALIASTRMQRFSARVIVLLLLLNSLMIFLPNFSAHARDSIATDARLTAISKLCGKGEYSVYGATEFHYSQFTEPYGILIDTPRWEETGPRPAKALLPFRDVLLYKNDCNLVPNEE